MMDEDFAAAKAAMERLSERLRDKDGKFFTKRIMGNWDLADTHTIDGVKYMTAKPDTYPDAPTTTKTRFAYGQGMLPKDYTTVLTSYTAMGLSPGTDDQDSEQIKQALQKLDAIGCRVYFEGVKGNKEKYDLVFRGSYPDKETWEKAYQFATLNLAKFWLRHVASILLTDASLEDLWFAIGFTPKKIPKQTKKRKS